MLLNVARKAPIKMRLVKIHEKDNITGQKCSQNVGEFTKITKIKIGVP